MSVSWNATRDHHITHHDEGGLMWSSCTCGWKSRKLDCYHNYQVTESRNAGTNHLSVMEARAWRASRDVRQREARQERLSNQ